MQVYMIVQVCLREITHSIVHIMSGVCLATHHGVDYGKMAISLFSDVLEWLLFC